MLHLRCHNQTDYHLCESTSNKMKIALFFFFSFITDFFSDYTFRLQFQCVTFIQSANNHVLRCLKCRRCERGNFRASKTDMDKNPMLHYVRCWSDEEKRVPVYKCFACDKTHSATLAPPPPKGGKRKHSDE